MIWLLVGPQMFQIVSLNVVDRLKKQSLGWAKSTKIELIKLIWFHFYDIANILSSFHEWYLNGSNILSILLDILF